MRFSLPLRRITHNVSLVRRFSTTPSKFSLVNIQFTAATPFEHAEATFGNFTSQESAIAAKQSEFRKAFSSFRTQPTNSQHLKSALELANEILGLTSSTFGFHHAVVASSFNNLGLVQKESGDYEGAINSFSEAIKIYLDVYGYDHQNTATALFNLAQAYKTYATFFNSSEENASLPKLVQEDRKIDLYKNAIELLKQVLDIRRKKISLLDEEAARIMQSLGSSQQALAQMMKPKAKAFKLNNNSNAKEKQYEERISEARANMLEGLDVVQKKFGRDHSQVAIALNNLGSFHRKEGENTEAIECYQKALKILNEKVNPQHADILLVKNNLAEAYNLNGDEEKAREVQEEILAIHQQKTSSM